MSQAHNSDGTIKDSAVTGLAGQSVSSSVPSDNDILTYNSGTSQWEPAAPAAAAPPDAADVTFTPAGSIASTDVQAAVAEVATDAASALSAHEADTTSVHGIADTSVLETTTGAQAKVDAHVNDTADAHDASAISFAAGSGIAATDVQAAIVEARADAIDRANHTGTQAASTISDFSESVDDRVNDLLQAGVGIGLTYDDNANTLTIDANSEVTEVTYDPSKDGTTPLDVKLFTFASGQSLDLTIENGRLRGTHSSVSSGNMRSIALVNGPDWVDSEVELVLWGPNTWGADANTRPQMGTVHRYGTSNGKQWGFVFWWNIFIFGPDVWNAAMWGSDETGGTNFNNASGGQYTTTTLQDRSAYSVRATRTSSFGWIHDHYLTSDGINRLKYLPSAAPITITEAADTTRTITGVSRVNGDANITFPTNTLLPQDVGKRLTGTGITAGTTVATVTSATAGTISANATATSSADLTISDYVTNPTVFNMASVSLNGAPDIANSKLQFVPADQSTGALHLNQRMKMTPSNLHQKFFPIVASSRLVGNRLQGRVARLGERLPEWEDTSRVLTVDLVAPTNLPSGFTTAGINSIPTNAGRCGIVFAHSINPNYMESGLFKAKKL